MFVINEKYLTIPNKMDIIPLCESGCGHGYLKYSPFNLFAFLEVEPPR